MHTTIETPLEPLERFTFPNIFEFHQRIENGVSALIVTPFRPDGTSDAYIKVDLDASCTYVEETFVSDASLVMNAVEREAWTRDVTVWRNVDRIADTKRLTDAIHAEIHLMQLERTKREES